ncbi:MAG: TonB-dependent receptor [Chloroherpetonaceae bacterium]|nr:TonB-dependent receptor [Chloroherpetonaceae bacterium]
MIANTRFNEQNASVSAGARLPFGIFALNYNYTKAKYGLQNQSQINLFQAQPDLIEKGRNNQVWYQNLDNSFISSNNTIFFGNHTLDVDLGYQMNRREGIGGAYNPQQRQLNIPSFALMQLNTFTANAKLNLSLEDKRLLFGLNFANVRNDADETRPNNPLLDSEINDAGVYAIADFKLAEPLIFTGGLRYDFRNMKSYPTQTQTTNQFKVDNTYNNLTGSIGVIYNVSPSQFVKVNLARGFRSPTMPELTQNGIHGGRYERGNPNFKPQINHQVNLNYHLHADWLTLDISPFYNIVSGYIYLVQTNEPAPIGQGRVFQHTQNDATLYGGEAMLDLHPLEWVGLHLTYSLVRAELSGDPLGFKHPTFIPQDRLIGEIKFEQKNLGFFKRPYLALEAMHFFEQNRTGQNETATPAYTLLNARAGASIPIGGQDIDVFIIGNNLTNAAYIDHLSVTKPLNLNMIGRNIVFGVQAPFALRKGD